MPRYTIHAPYRGRCGQAESAQRASDIACDLIDAGCKSAFVLDHTPGAFPITVWRRSGELIGGYTGEPFRSMQRAGERMAQIEVAA